MTKLLLKVNFLVLLGRKFYHFLHQRGRTGENQPAKKHLLVTVHHKLSVGYVCYVCTMLW